MGRENKLSIIGQVQKSLDSKLAIGESKHHAKIVGVAHDHIYSWNTYRTYLKHGCYFVKWAKVKYGCKTLEQARLYVDEYLQSRSHLSAYTQKLDASALAKVYGCKTTDFVATEVRHRADISRSRGEKVRDRNFSESRNKEFVDFCRSTGLRRSEISELRGNQLVQRNDKFYIEVTGKGGRTRLAPVIGEVKNVVDRMMACGNEKVWSKVPNGADIHSYRSQYATSIYNSLAKPKELIPKEDRYCCRGDLKGTWYDKKAMIVVSNALGHNRISIIAGHYIRA